jgi:hypothetical protein
METIYTTALSDQAQPGVRHYAKDAVNATGQKVVDIKAKAGILKNQGSQYIADQPVRAALMAAVGGAALMALLVSAMRRNR